MWTVMTRKMIPGGQHVRYHSFASETEARAFFEESLTAISITEDGAPSAPPFTPPAPRAKTERTYQIRVRPVEPKPKPKTKSKLPSKPRIIERNLDFYLS